MDQNEKNKIRMEMQPVMDELKRQGISHNTTEVEMTGLGDVVEATLEKFGVTQERFKSWFGLQECRCTERKKWLNNLFSWERKRKT